MRTIVVKESDNRTQSIFRSKSGLKITFLPIYKYQKLNINNQWIENLQMGYFDWIIFTSYRSWEILYNLNSDGNACIPVLTKIAVFGPASVKRIKALGGRIDFTVRAHDAYEYGTKLLKHIDNKNKFAYPASSAASQGLERCFLIKKIKIDRQNIYKPKCIINPDKINETMKNIKPDSMVFFSAKAVQSFMANCSNEILDQIGTMKLFALGKPTAKALQKYSLNEIIKPEYPDIYKLSDLIYKVFEIENKNYVS